MVSERRSRRNRRDLRAKVEALRKKHEEFDDLVNPGLHPEAPDGPIRHRRDKK